MKFGERDDEIQLDVVASERAMERNKLTIQKYPQQGVSPPRAHQKARHSIEVALVHRKVEADE